MEMFERIRKLRKEYLHLSQEEFGKRLGVSRSVIANIELNMLARPDQKEPLIKLICKEFNVNEDWLRTGAGGDENIFIPEDAQQYVALGKAARTPNEFREFLGKIIDALPDEYCDYLYEEFVKFQKKYKKGE